MNRIPDQRKGDQHQRCSGNQQDDAYFTNIVIDILHQRFLIGHLLYHIISRQPLFNHHQRIVIGIQRIQLYLNGRQQRVVPQNLLEIFAQFLLKLPGRLVLADENGRCHKRLGIQYFLSFSLFRLHSHCPSR